MNRISVLLFCLLPAVAFATDPYKRNDVIDVQRYTFQLEVNDSTDVIAGEAIVDLLFVRDARTFELDLADRNGKKDGMEVTSVTCNGKTLKFTHANEKLLITLDGIIKKNSAASVVIRYNGIARDGFVIGKNKFGDRGFFGDNYPDRGHHWLPVVDHPSDKAGVDWVIIAPQYYSVVANGVRVEETPVDGRRKLTRYHEGTPLPVKTMVVGIARFSMQRAGIVDQIPVETWVYPQNRDNGYSDFSIAVKILDYFHTHVGPYAYRKLANVQSKTRWGGLENAGAIFYYENIVTGKGGSEGLIAHEEAHQWFGNSISEKDWQHVWLSEGFATYFSALYLEHAYGRDKMVEEQAKNRASVIKFSAVNSKPVVDTTNMDLNTILTTNSYQKGGLVLHMLRHKLGDVVFWKGIQAYYLRYKNGNALTSDFQHSMEEASGQDLSAFFKQWLWRGGHPKVVWSWSYNAATKAVYIKIEQTQAVLFDFPLEIELQTGAAKSDLTSFTVNAKTQQFSIPAAAKPDKVSLDPGVWLLFESQYKP